MPTAPGTKEQPLGDATSERTDTASSSNTCGYLDASTECSQSAIRSARTLETVTPDSEDGDGVAKEYVGYGLTMRFPRI